MKIKKIHFLNHKVFTLSSRERNSFAKSRTEKQELENATIENGIRCHLR